MSAFRGSEYDSDMSDEGPEEEEVLSGWLDEEDPEEEVVVKPIVIEQPKIDVVHKSKYIVDNSDLFYALCEVDDWGFVEFPDQQQEDLMRCLTVKTYQPGENVIVEGDGGGDCYIVSASEDTVNFSEVEVVTGNINDGTEVFLTKLQRGQYFGQKFFLTRRAQKRGATVRVPKDSKVAVNIAVLSPEHFDKWDSFRNLLLVKTVPMIQMLPRKERQRILQNLSIRDFKDGDYIIRQGEQGEEFFIIQEGSVKVVETRPSLEHGWERPYEHTLVTLREGHFFGEMALLTNEPRVASVIAINKLTICLILKKQDFRNILSDESFGEVLNEVLMKRKIIRANRESSSNNDNTSDSNSNTGGSPRNSLGNSSISSNVTNASRRKSMRKRSSTTSPYHHSQHSGEVSISTTLSMRKLESGSRVVNKYIVEKELGKGSFGDVYLCRDQETNEYYAMKMINRPQSSWNDDAAISIKQEIAVMKKLKHINIVNLHEVIDDINARKIFLIQEYMEGGPLMADSEQCDPVNISLARTYFRDILRGVCYLHSEGIIHRDIKPQNMLLSADGTVKIADFGAAVFTTNDDKVAYGGTPAFMAPELFLTNSSTDFTKNEGIDVFALGATLYFMLCGKPPWMAKNQLDLASKIKNIELTFPSTTIDPHVKHLLRQMLAKDYRTRCDLDSIVVDDWVTFEGSEPLFDTIDYTGTSYTEFLAFALQQQAEQSEEDNLIDDSYYVLIMGSRYVHRTLFSQKINTIHHSICTCLSTEQEVLDMMSSARAYNTIQNFDFLFIEVKPNNKGLEIIKEIKNLGYNGRIIAVNYTNYDITELVSSDAADAQVKFPIPIRELTKLLSSDGFEDIEILQQASAELNSAGVTMEDINDAITFHHNVDDTHSVLSHTTSHSHNSSSGQLVDENELNHEGSRDLGPSLTSASLDQEEEEEETGTSATPADIEEEEEGPVGDDTHMQDFQQKPLHSLSAKTILSISTDGNHSSSDDEGDGFVTNHGASRLNLGGAKNLSRKRAFKVVPYSTSTDTNNSPKNQPYDSKFPSAFLSSPLTPTHTSTTTTANTIIDQTVTRQDSNSQMLLIPFSNREDNRRKRREAAMNKSKLAHQYREAKKNGDIKALQSSKSLLNLLTKTKSRKISKINNTTTSNNNKQSEYSINSNNMEDGEEDVHVLSESTKDLDSFLGVHHTASPDKLNSHEKKKKDQQQQYEQDQERQQQEQQYGSGSRSHDSSSSSLHRGILQKPKQTYRPDDESDSDAGEIVSDSDFDYHDDDDDDSYGDLDEPIQQLDDDGLDDVFNAIANSATQNKETEENNDLIEWNHIMINKHINPTLIASMDNTNIHLELKIGKYESIVSRSYMEDRIYTCVNEPGSDSTGCSPLALCAVYDGHNGSYVSQILQDKFASTFTALYRSEELHTEFKEQNYQNQVIGIFEETSLLLDTEILRSDYIRQQQTIKSGIQDVQSFAGSAAVMLAVLPVNHHETHSGKKAKSRMASMTEELLGKVQVFVAHVGDCRAVLCNDGVAIQLTIDHKPILKTEKQRIETAGGWVHNGRVNGSLGVSRSFGDIQFKSFSETPGYVNGKEDLLNSIWAPTQHVISKPEIKHFIVEQPFEFIILACDGLWDVFDCQEAVNFVRKRLSVTRDVSQTAQELVQKAIKRGTQDNTSVVIVAFHQTEAALM